MSTLPNSSLIGLEETPEGQTRACFLDCLHLIERLHRRMLDIVKMRLEQEGRTDINSVQALLVYNIGDNEMTAGELTTRGYYLGTNVSYNLKKLVEMGYIEQKTSEHDRRSIRIRLSEKGSEVSALLSQLYDEQLDQLLDGGYLDKDAVRGLRNGLRNLDSYWTNRVNFSVL